MQNVLSGMSQSHIICIHVYIFLLEFHDRLKIENSSSSLHDACYRGSLSEVQWLILKFGYEAYARGHHGWSFLHSAAYGGHIDVLHYLIDNKCDPNVCDDEDVTLLHVSSYKGHTHIVTYLIDTCNVPVDAVDTYNTTAVMYATLGGQDEVVNLLISKYHCNTSVCSKARHSLSLLACQSSQKKVIVTLESLQLFNPQSVDNLGRGVIHYSCAGGSVKILQYLLQHYNLDLTVQDNEGKTGLHIAAMYTSTEVVQYIMKKLGPQVALETDSRTNTPLYYAYSDLMAVHGSKMFCKFVSSLGNRVCYQLPTSDCTIAYASYTTAINNWSPIKMNERLSLVSWMLEQCNTLPHFNINATHYNGRTLLHTACSLSLVKSLVEQHQLNPYQGDTYGCLPVHFAAEFHSRSAIVEYFIVDKAMDTSITDNDGNTILHRAALTKSNINNLSLVKLLVEQYQLNPYQVNKFGRLPVHIAAAFGHTAIVEYFIVDKAMDTSITDNDGNTILHRAAFANSNINNLSLVKLLVEQYQLNPYQGDKLGRLPVHIAAQFGHTTIVEYFIVDKAMDTSITDNDGNTILHRAAFAKSNINNLSLVKLLVEQYQLNPYQGNKLGRLPVHIAAAFGHTAIVEYFIVNKAMDTSITDNDGNTILHRAAFANSNINNLSLVKLLVEQYQLNPYQGNKLGCLPVHTAAEFGHTTIVEYFIVDKAMDTSITDNDGNTILHRAALANSNINNLSLVKLLVEQYQLNPYQGDKLGRLPVHIAAHSGQTTLIEYFISQCHVNIAIRSSYGYNIVHYATLKGHYNTTKYLSTVYINGFSVPDIDGELPIHTACQSGNIQLVNYLVDEIGCDISSLTNSHQSCAVFACMSGNLNLLKLLATKYSLDLTVTDRDGFTLLHYAAEKGHNHIIEWLIEEHKLDPLSTSNNATTTLHKAASGGVSSTVEFLYEKYSLDVNSTTTTNKYTPLHSATVKGHVPVVQYLTKLPQCNVTAKDSDGSTVLHLSSKHGFIKLLEHYLGSHSDLAEHNNLYNSKNMSPLDVGCIYGNLPVVKYLVEDPRFTKGDINNSDKKKAFTCALIAKHSDIMYYLFNKVDSAQIPSYLAIHDPTSGNMPHHIACSSGNLDIVKSFTDAACSSNPLLLADANTSAYNIFHFAATNGSLPVVNYLVHVITNILCAFTSVNATELLEAKTKEGYTPLHLSCVNGHIEVVKSLATLCPSTIFMVDNNGRGLMHAAARTTNVKLIEYLADEHSLKSDASDKSGVTPLHIAAEIGNFISFKALVNYTSKSGNYNPVSHNGKTPFSLACKNGCDLITSYLVEDLKISVDTSSTTSTTYTPLHLAASNDKVTTVQLLVEKFSVNVNCTLLNDNSTPLHLATIKGHVAVVLYLTGLPQCNVAATLTDGSTVLHLSSKHGHYHLVKHFVKNHKQLVTLYNNSNMTPLHCACRSREGHVSIVKCLIEQGHSDTAVQDNDGHTCYHLAVIRSYIDVVKYLVSLDESVVSLAIANNSGSTSLHIACSSDSPEMVKVLVEAVTDRNPSILALSDSDGNNAIHCAAKRGIVSIMGSIVGCLESKKVVYLLAVHNSLGQTPLHVACLYRYNILVMSLATSCPSTIPMVDINSRGLMHAAAETGNADMVKYLAEKHKLSRDTPDKWGITPTHMLQFIAAFQHFSRTL